VGQTCENQLDYYTALIQAGLGKYVKHCKTSRYHSTSGNVSSSHGSKHYTPVRMHTNTPYSAYNRERAWQRYCATVPEEYRGRSFIDAQKPMTQSQFKAMSDYASMVFDGAIVALDRAYYGRGASW
jgi:hypothetical protein